MTGVVAEGPASRAVASWRRCEGCDTVHYVKKLARCLDVCPNCEHHHRLDARTRIEQLVDDGSFVPSGVRALATDVLRFTDTVPYRARLARVRDATGLPDAVVCGTARVEGRAVALAVMDFRFMGGSLGVAVGEQLARIAEVALEQRIPLVVVTASGGARMQEGVRALLQMAKVSQAIARLREAALLTVSVVTDPTYGGVAASFAANCDVVAVEQGARMGFAGPRVIEQTIRQRLPVEFQSARFLYEHGQVDAVLHRRDLRSWLARLVGSVSGAGSRDGQDSDQEADARVTRDAAELPDRDPWTVVSAARDLRRPTITDYFGTVLDDFVELHGDGVTADCPAIVAGLGLLDGEPVAAIGHQKGHDTKELIAHNFGMPSPEGYRKALRVMRLAARLRIPVMTMVDTPGAYPGQEAEEHGQSFAIASNILEMFEFPIPIVTVITGEGGSGGALALAVADRVLMLERTVYSVISPEGCASILWGDAGYAERAARELHMTARELLDMSLVDAVVREPDGGVDSDPTAVSRTIRRAVSREFRELSAMDGPALTESRRQRFRAVGADGLLLAESE